MEVRDLCIGNTIQVGDKVQKLTFKMLCAAGKKLNGIKPVVITAEILESIGFSFVPNARGRVIYYRKGFHVEKLSTHTWKVEQDTTLIMLWAHQIENLVHFSHPKDV